jgi:hypothetical protein
MVFVEKYIAALDFLDVKPKKVIFSLTQLRRRFFLQSSQQITYRLQLNSENKSTHF